MGEVGHDGILTRLIATLDEESGDVNYGIRVARTRPKQQFTQPPPRCQASGRLAGTGRESLVSVEQRGSIYVEGTGDAWAIETVNMTLLPAGLIDD